MRLQFRWSLILRLATPSFVLLLVPTYLSAQPRALLQWSTVQALGNQVILSRVPVYNSSGVLKYYDISLSFTIDSAGKPALNTTGTKVSLSPDLVVGSFKPGIYKNDDCRYAVGTPGVVGGGRVSGS